MMKRGKKLAALILAAVVGVSAAGCAKKDPETIYKEAVEKANEANSMDAAVRMTMAIAQGEESLDMDIVMDMKASGLKEGDFKYAADGNISLMGQSMDMKQYYADGYQYVDMMGMKVKQAVELDQMMEQARSLAEGGSMGLEYIENLTAEKNGDNTLLSYTVNGEKMTDLSQEYMGDMMQAMGVSGTDMQALFEGLDFQINSASGTMTVNKAGYPTAYQMDMDMEVSAEGESIHLTMGVEYQINNPGQETEVTIPDTSGYTEVPGLGTELQETTGEVQ